MLLHQQHHGLVLPVELVPLRPRKPGRLYPRQWAFNRFYVLQVGGLVLEVGQGSVQQLDIEETSLHPAGQLLGFDVPELGILPEQPRQLAAQLSDRLAGDPGLGVQQHHAHRLPPPGLAVQPVVLGHLFTKSIQAQASIYVYKF